MEHMLQSETGWDAYHAGGQRRAIRSVVPANGRTADSDDMAWAFRGPSTPCQQRPAIVAEHVEKAECLCLWSLINGRWWTGSVSHLWPRAPRRLNPTSASACGPAPRRCHGEAQQQQQRDRRRAGQEGAAQQEGRPRRRRQEAALYFKRLRSLQEEEVQGISGTGRPSPGHHR
jgi:hypothetical protein